MTADELRAALEVELAWRQEELAFFKNQLNEIAEEFSNWETKVSEILSTITRLLYDYANNEKYLA